MNFDPNKPPPFIIMESGPSQQPMVDPLMTNERMNVAQSNAYHNARIRQQFAIPRASELRIILDSMREIRDAIHDVTVAPGDRGSGERAPVMTAFDEGVREKLMYAYLRMAERCVNYSEKMMTDLSCPMTNEYKERPSPPIQSPKIVEVKTTRKKKDDASPIPE